jgi:phosphoribosylamine--glycine ligase
MKVLLVGNGGREHALLWKLADGDPRSEFFITVGNGGTADLAIHVPVSPADIEGMARFAAEEGIDLTVVGPELPLADGIVDSFRERGLRVFGPTREAARLETSKAFAKDLMRKHGIPTADYVVFRDYDEAKDYINMAPFPVVVKASGLAAGKGAIVCGDRPEALEALASIMVERRFGDSGMEVVIEEYLEGEELSVFCLTDGEEVLPMIPSQDHKRIFDGDRGPNTGGMGAYAPVSVADEGFQDIVRREILEPVVEAMACRGTPYAGLLYAGLMLTSDGPKVVEFNCRFGDPETQAILPLMEDNLLELLLGVSEGKLARDRLNWREGTAVCVVLASAGYPGRYEKGKEIEIEERLRSMDRVHLFHAGTVREGGRLLTNGGRVMGVTALGADIGDAVGLAYEACDAVHFDGKYLRNDIGKRERERQ